MEQIDMKELVAAVIFDWAWTEEEGCYRPHEEVCCKIAEEIVTKLAVSQLYEALDALLKFCKDEYGHYSSRRQDQVESRAIKALTLADGKK